MRQHFKGIIWPRDSRDSKVRNGKKIVDQKVYRYVVVGMIVTDEPITKFEGKNELLLDGPVNDLVEPLITIKDRKPRFKAGDASGVLCYLDDL